MKIKVILWIGLFLYGIQWIRHQFAYLIFIKFHEFNLIDKVNELNQMNNTSSLYAIITILCVGFLCLINIKKLDALLQENKQK
jgi:hypothetical protein